MSGGLGVTGRRLVGHVAACRVGDFILDTDRDVLMDDSKRYRYGFTETVHTEERMLELLAQFRAERIIP